MQTLSVKIAQCVFGLNIQSKAIHEVLSSAWRAFVTADTRLAAAATIEGFKVFLPT